MIRGAQTQDRAPVEALLAGAGLPIEGVAEHLHCFFVEDDGGRIAGAAGLELYGEHALLRSVVVAEGARGAGLGSTLTRRALDESRARAGFGARSGLCFRLPDEREATMFRSLSSLGAAVWVSGVAVASCSSHSSGETGVPDAAVSSDAGVHSDAPTSIDAPPPPPGAFCSLPGSVQWTAQGPVAVPGGSASAPDLTWLTLPPGFCAHYFATVPDVRQLRVAPGGDVFAASPTTGTTGGNTAGALAGVVVLPDDDHDGYADSQVMFVNDVPSVQGLLFANGSFYYQDDATLRGMPYQPRDRAPSGAPQPMTTVTAPQDTLHWPKVMDIATDGTIFVTNGGSQLDQCLSTNPTRGAVFSVQPDGTTALVAKGFRNPIALRCEKEHDVCLAAELALDFSGAQGGREKLVVVRPGDDWGYPCCATQNVPYGSTTYTDTGATPDCSGVTPDIDSFIIGHTPFGLDFETGKWPAPWGGRVFVTLHGVNGTWEGARVVAIALDPSTGVPVPATELNDAGAPDAMLQFAVGWDDGMRDHGRPAPIEFAPDGRMFLGDDNRGIIVWIAPADLMSQ